MTTIIAGMFDTIDKAEGAVGKLLYAGFREEDVSSFANDQPGQQATLLKGDDENDDAKVSGVESDTDNGTAIELGAGAAISEVVAGPRGAGVVVAVRIEDRGAEQPAISILNSEGAIWSMSSSGR